MEITEGAQAELDRMKAFDHRRVLEAVATQLTHQPNVETRNRKRLGEGVTADFEFVPPLWALRVAEYRVFYEIDDAGNRVMVHAVREKPPGKTTPEVLR